jgi:hypothetical protein
MHLKPFPPKLRKDLYIPDSATPQEGEIDNNPCPNCFAGDPMMLKRALAHHPATLLCEEFIKITGLVLGCQAALRCIKLPRSKVTSWQLPFFTVTRNTSSPMYLPHQSISKLTIFPHSQTQRDNPIQLLCCSLPLIQYDEPRATS